MKTNSAEKPPDPLVEAMKTHAGNLDKAVKAISRRVETNAKGNTTLLFIHYAVNVGDEGFELIGELEHLEYLDATNSPVTNAGVKPLGQLQSLKELILDISEVGNDGLEHLGGMKLLRRLSLSATRVSDPGLKHLVGLTTLESLNLSNTSVTNHGLKYL